MIRVTLCGIGGVGKAIVRLARDRQGLKVVAAYSRGSRVVGTDVGALAGGPEIGVNVTERVTALRTESDILLIATTPFLRDVLPEVLAGVEARLNVVSTAEEMAFPWHVDPRLAREIDEAARTAGVSVVGVGANPGYIYEIVGLALTGAVQRVDRVEVRRVVDLSGFGEIVQRRLGIGFDAAEFAQGIRDHAIHGHIGFPHTIRTFGRRLDVDIERVDEVVEPILTDHPLIAHSVETHPGRSVGIRQRATGIVDGRPWFKAEFIGHIAPRSAGLEPEDAYVIEGVPTIRATVSPGFDPQTTTASVLANVMPRVLAAHPGLLSVVDLPIPTPWR